MQTYGRGKKPSARIEPDTSIASTMVWNWEGSVTTAVGRAIATVAAASRIDHWCPVGPG